MSLITLQTSYFKIPAFLSKAEPLKNLRTGFSRMMHLTGLEQLQKCANQIYHKNYKGAKNNLLEATVRLVAITALSYLVYSAFCQIRHALHQYTKATSQAEVEELEKKLLDELEPIQFVVYQWLGEAKEKFIARKKDATAPLYIELYQKLQNQEPMKSAIEGFKQPDYILSKCSWQSKDDLDIAKFNCTRRYQSLNKTLTLLKELSPLDEEIHRLILLVPALEKS